MVAPVPSLAAALKKFSKLKITVVSENADHSDEIEVQFNPESYTRDSKITFQPAKTIHAHLGRETLLEKSVFTGQPLEEISFKLQLDGTSVSDQDGALLGFLTSMPETVESRIGKIIDTCLHVNTNLHEPSIVKLEWGSMSFIGRMVSAKTSYLLFDTNGSPMRATMDVKFTGYFENAEVTASFSSPDLTHTLTVRAGDTLPLMTEKIYGSAKYYPLVAGFNQLDDFRNLSPGQKILFPPIDMERS